MSTLNANPTVYAPVVTRRGGEEVKSWMPSVKLDTLTNVKTFRIRSNNQSNNQSIQHYGSSKAFDDAFSNERYSELYHEAARDEQSNNQTNSQQMTQSNDQSNDQSNSQSVDPWDSLEVFDLVRHINDPEHPLTLEALKVLQLELIDVKDDESSINLRFTPTIPHCSMATLIGLCIRVKLIRTLPSRFKVDVSITPGAHATEDQINKQLNDKERVAAALENNHLLDIVNKCLDEK